mmetsp:Transcript_78615/g.212813  ORF Transcript_78615/g.212813 Transcript_78615/m.212813 type:complete len:277 (+) Transcript_78615:217-1047(+)
MWWNSIDMVTASKASSVPRAQRRPDWSLHYQCAERPASTGSLLVPRLREARGGAARSGAALGHPAGTEASEDFWQKMEDSELKLTKASWRREQFLHKDLVVQVDPLHDSSLYDLKVNHNSAQRARSVALPTPPSSAPSGSGRPRGGPSRGRESARDVAEGAPQRVRELREALGSSQADTASALGISLKHLGDARALPGDPAPGAPAGVPVLAPGGRQAPSGAAADAAKCRGASSVVVLRPGRDRSKSIVFNDGLKEILRRTRVDFSTPVMPRKPVK